MTSTTNSQADQLILLEILNDGMSMVSAVTGFDDFESLNESSKTPKTFLNATNLLLGRDAEIKLLQECVDRVSLGSSELLFVSGSSGVGKSSLVESLRQGMEESDKFYLVSGKFDQYLRREPFSAISAAFGELVDLFQRHSKADEIVAALRTGLSPEELQILCSFVSSLQTVVGTPGDPHEFRLRHYQAFDGFKMICQKFLRILSSYATLCIFLDDVQWADPESLQVLTSLAKVTESTNVLLVAAYRELTHSLEEFLAQEYDLMQTHVLLEDLDEGAVNQTIATILDMETSKTQPLGELVYSRTMGNPYHLIQFMQSLHRNRLISSEDNSWTWDLAQIQSDTFVSDNVADLILSKIGSLPAFVQGILKLGSCLGYQFDADLLKRIALGFLPPQNREQMADVYGTRIDQALEVGIKEGLLERCKTNGAIKFTHDRVQQSLYGLFSDHELPTLHVRVGRLLQESLQELEDVQSLLVLTVRSLQESLIASDEKVVSLLFLTVEQLNRGLELTDISERVGIAELNLRASQVAMSKSAFQASTDYILVSFSLLAANWESDYNLTLRAYTTAAQYHCCTGRFEESKAAADAVLLHAKTSLEKMPVYYTMIDAFGSQDLLSDALDLGNKILNKELKVKAPSCPS
ncbi:PhoQ sensor [Fragilaria crotonensis]|nr:PhoQ sensor [Fragilaria crotonensis]